VSVADARDVLLRVAEQELFLCRGATFLPAVEMLEQRGEPFGPLWVVSGRVQARERRVRQELDRRTASASASNSAPDCARPSM
jgi:hypothetical protein